MKTMRKFKTNDIINIRHKGIIEKVPAAKLATRYKTSPSTISSILQNKTYVDVPQPKVISGFNNYLVYPNGKVWSKASNRFLKAKPKKEGYKARYVTLRSNGQQRSFNIKETVAQLFN